MGLYAEKVFPRLSENALNNRQMGKHRAAALRDVSGEILEIGFGSGSNLPYYPAEVTHLTAIEPSGGMTARAAERIAQWPGTVALQHLAGERLPFEDAKFDAVVTTLTLCTVDDPAAVARETRRVLRPGGKVHFLEHVASTSAKARTWQGRLNGLNRVIACGCNLNRDSTATYLEAGFNITRLEHVFMPGPDFMKPLFPGILGVAVAPA